MTIKPPLKKIVIQLSVVIFSYLALAIPLINNALWHDEIYKTSLYLNALPAFTQQVKQDIPQMVWSTDWKRQIALHPPLVYSFYYVWIRLFGDSEVSLHIPVAIAGLLGIIILYFLGDALFDNDIGFMATLATVFSASHIIYSVQVVHAIFEMLIFLASFLCLTRFIITKNTRLFKLLLILNIIGVCTFYYYIFYLIVQTIVLWILNKDLKIKPLYFITALLLAACLLVFVKYNYDNKKYFYPHWPKNDFSTAIKNIVFLPRRFTQ